MDRELMIGDSWGSVVEMIKNKSKEINFKDKNS